MKKRDVIPNTEILGSLLSCIIESTSCTVSTEKEACKKIKMLHIYKEQYY